MDNKITSVHALPLNSECKIEFLYSKQLQKIIPVLMLTGIKALNGLQDRVRSKLADGHIGIITAGYNDKTHTTYTNITGDDGGEPILINPYMSERKPGDWLLITTEDLLNGAYEIVYPRIFINSLELKTDSDSLVLKYKNQNNQKAVLEPYKDYSILTRALENNYVLTLNNDLILKNNFILNKINESYDITNFDQPLSLNYIISNADTSIYLDALEIAEENSKPKVSYNTKLEYIDLNFIKSIPNLLGHLTCINDIDLKFHNVKGYVSSITLDLDNPEQDNIEIKNYKTKFEDLFSTITAQTEVMKKSSQVLLAANTAFTSTGDLSQEVLQSSIQKVDLNYAFNNGKLTIDLKNGIWGINDNGVVAFRGGGIFTSTEKDAEGNWKWNTGITPEGINANLITSGQLDTNLIKIYAGDHLRFQMNGDGIFAYKTKISDAQDGVHPIQTGTLSPENSADSRQYVVFNDNGLSLVAKKGAQVLKEDKIHYYTVLSEDFINEAGKNRQHLANLNSITRVLVSWDGFILRNWENEKVFYADPLTGNLTIKGHIEANTGKIGAWQFNEHRLWAEDRQSALIAYDLQHYLYNIYVALNSGGDVNEQIEFTYEVEGANNTTQLKTETVVVDTTPYALWAGHKVPNLAPLVIRKDGYFKATAGEIGGWQLSSSKLYTQTLTFLSGIATNLSGTAGQADTQSDLIPTINNDYAIFWINKGQITSGVYTATSYNVKDAPFYVTANGCARINDIWINYYGTTRSLGQWMNWVDEYIMTHY